MTKLKVKFQVAGFILICTLSFQVHAKERQTTILKSLSPPWGSTVPFIPPQHISKNRILVASGSTLYLLNQRQEILWKFDAQADINGFTYVSDLNTVYVIAMDLTWLAVDAKTGLKRWFRDANGKATYTDIATVGKDKYVAVTDMSGYDGQFTRCEEKKAEGESVNCKREDPDIVELMQDRKVLGLADFPPNGHLAIVGEQVFAIITGKDSVTLQKIDFKKTE